MNPWSYDYYYSDQTWSRPEGLPNDFTLEEHDLLSQVNLPDIMLPGFPLQDIPLYPSPPGHEDNNNSASLNTPPPPSAPPRRRDESSVAIKTAAASPPVPLSGHEQTLFNIDSFLENEPPSSVPPVPSLRMHYSLNPYPGPHNFTVTIPTFTEIGLKPKWCYSPIVNKVYAAKRVTFPINIKMEKFIPEASILICPIYSIPSTISIPVKRCYLCETSDALVEAKGHIIQVEGCPCKYFNKDNRCMAVVRLPMPAPGDSSSQLLVKMACNTSCVGGPNRRPFSIMLSLGIRNEEVGRQVIHTKCCESPIRDMRRDEAGIRKITPSMMQPKAKEPEAGSNEGPEKQQEKGEGSVKETKRKKIKTEIAVEPPTSLDYLWVPARFHKKVKRYLNFLYMQEQCKLMKVQLKKFDPSETESD